MLVPVFMLLLLGLLEFGFVFDHTMTVSYATREGARSGAAFAQGNASIPCANIDQNIIDAVKRVLTAPGSLVDRLNVATITIYKAQPDGDARPAANSSNVWTNDGAGNFQAPGTGATATPSSGTPAAGSTGSRPTRSAWPSSTTTSSSPPCRPPWASSVLPAVPA